MKVLKAGNGQILSYLTRAGYMKALAAVLLLVWCAQGASLGHIHYIPGTQTPAMTRVITLTGVSGTVPQKSHRNGIRDDNCPLCKLSVHMAVLTVPQQVVFVLVHFPLPRITPVIPRTSYVSPRSHHWIGRGPPA